MDEDVERCVRPGQVVAVAPAEEDGFSRITIVVDVENPEELLKPGMTASAEEIIAWCQRHLARYKCPRHVVFVDEIPRLPSGKALRRTLKEDWLTE